MEKFKADGAYFTPPYICNKQNKIVEHCTTERNMIPFDLMAWKRQDINFYISQFKKSKLIDKKDMEKGVAIFSEPTITKDDVNIVYNYNN